MKPESHRTKEDRKMGSPSFCLTFFCQFILVLIPSLVQAEDHSENILSQVRHLTALARSGQLSESLDELASVEKDLLPTDTALARIAVLEARIAALWRESNDWPQIQSLLDAAERAAEASASTELPALVLLSRADTANAAQRYDEALNTLQRLRKLPDIPNAIRLRALVTEAATQHYIGQLEAAKRACVTGIEETTDFPLVQAQMRSTLALTLFRMEENDEALRHAEAAIRVLSDHTEDRACAESLASAHLTRAILRGKSSNARSDYQRAVELWEQLYGKASPSLIPALTSQGYGLLNIGDLDEAERVLQRGLDLAQRNRLIPFHQITLLENLTLLRLQQKRPDDAKALAAQMRDIWANWVPLVLEAGSEAERLNLLLQSHWIDSAIAAGDEPKAVEAILANYGSVFDSLLRDTALAARLPRDERQRYKQSQARLAALSLHGDATAETEEVSRLRRLVQSLGSAVAGVYDPGGVGPRQHGQTPSPTTANQAHSQTEPIRSGVSDPGYSNTAALRAALPDDGALVVFASYRGFDFRLTRRLAAAVLTREAQYLVLLPMSIDSLDRVGKDLIKSLELAETEQAQQQLQTLHEGLITPLKAALGSASNLHLCLDGSMNRVPATLWALPTTNQKSEIINHKSKVTFLTSPRALLRQASKPAATNTTWMIVNTGHEALHFPADQAFPYSIANGYENHTLRALPGADKEVRTLVETHPDRWLLLRTQLDDGTTADPGESAFTQILADPPTVLHIAGHADHGDQHVSATDTSKWWQGLEQPKALWTSCLYFPHPEPATNPDDASNDNYLFAAEIAALDLTGTQLVTLSACQTGTGLSPLSEGHYSLARAFHTAGARDVISCTEPLLDANVTALMKPFYDRVAKGEDPAQAFWEEQTKAIGGDMTKLRAFGFFRLTRAWAGK